MTTASYSSRTAALLPIRGRCEANGRFTSIGSLELLTRSPAKTSIAHTNLASAQSYNIIAGAIRIYLLISKSDFILISHSTVLLDKIMQFVSDQICVWNRDTCRAYCLSQQDIRNCCIVDLSYFKFPLKGIRTIESNSLLNCALTLDQVRISQFLVQQEGLLKALRGHSVKVTIHLRPVVRLRIICALNPPPFPALLLVTAYLYANNFVAEECYC
jgi:hypothetical protein